MFQAAIFVILIVPIFAVDRGNFKTCDQSSFCRYVLVSCVFAGLVSLTVGSIVIVVIKTCWSKLRLIFQYGT